MAKNRAQAWLTCVTRNEVVTSALILAESLRRTRTTKRISVIASGNRLTRENKRALRNSFDDVFWLDLSTILDDDTKIIDNDVDFIAKIFAFSLEIFERCILLGPHTIVLENSDRLFNGNDIFTNLLLTSGKRSLDLFRFNPSKALCEHLEDGYGFIQNNGTGPSVMLKYIQQWINNTSGNKENQDNKIAGNEPNGILEFSLKTGKIHTENGKLEKPKIVHFVDVLDKETSFPETLKELQKNSSLVTEIIINTWLALWENVTKSLHAPNPQIDRPLNQSKGYFDGQEPIAIVGMSCRFPGAANLEEFWNLLYEGKEGIRTPPAFRWKREQAIFPISGKERQTNAGFLTTTVDDFDAKFFGVSPKEALFLDPQARLLHEVLWESLECSGIDPQSLYGTHTGIFTGSWMNDYKDVVQRSTELDFFRTYMGNSMGATAARLSFLLGLTGPSIATESGCSSAIVAVDLAVKSLRSGETNLALVGGVNLLLHPFESNIIDYVISPDGRCKTFDANADGFGRAEGCGVLVLKKLSDALRDRDNIWGMIRGSAVSQEGLSRSLGTPTVHCEALAMQLALKDAGVRPEQVSFVETHGTGTAVGDPMEVAAICEAYHSDGRKEPLIIGSVKTNVGHTESCSGITGIIKAVLSMQNELIPKHLNLETLNPQVNLDLIPAIIPMEHIKWPKIQGEPRLAGVSSFGITGTDGHVIVEEAPEIELPTFKFGLVRPLHILKISGKSKESLEDLLKSYENTFKDIKENESFCNAAYTANTGRASFNHRAFLLASTFEEAVSQLENNKIIRGDTTGSEIGGGKICFLFTGQGSQYTGMAKVLYETSPIFRIHFDYCDAILKENHNISIAQAIWNTDFKELSRTIYSQTAIFCVEYCLLKLWESWGIKPDIVLGHSLGECCAAVAAKILSFEDALKLVAERSRLIDNLPRGSMLVIKSNKSEVEKLLLQNNIQLEFAAVNSLDQTVVAGDTKVVENFKEILNGKGVKCIILESTHAFHSRHMDAMLDDYRKVALSIKYYPESSTGCQFISGMEGRLMDDKDRQEINPNYWVRHTREKVSFMQACEQLKKMNVKNFLEIGPNPVLSTFVLQNIEDYPVSCYPSLRKNTNDWETILGSLGKLYLGGFKVDWMGFDKMYSRKKVNFLPFHPFNKKQFWVETTQNTTPVIHPLVGHSVPNASSLNIFENSVSTNAVGYLKDHCIGNLIVFPGAGFTEMCLTAGYCVANGLTDTLEKPKHAVCLENVRIMAPLELKEGKGCKLQTIVSLQESGSGNGEKRSSGFEVKIFHKNEQCEITESQRNWVPHASAIFHPFVGVNGILAQGGKWKPERIKELVEGAEGAETDAFYKMVDGAGLKFGEKFRTLKKQWRCEKGDKNEGQQEMDEIVAEIGIPDEFEKYVIHPTVIDAMIQAAMLSGFRASQTNNTTSAGLRVPVGIRKLTLFGSQDQNQDEKKDDSLYLHVTWEQGLYSTVFLTTANFTPIALLEGLEVIETNVKTIQSVLETQTKHLPDSWEEIWKPIFGGPHDNRVSLTPVAPIFETEDFQQEVEKRSGKATAKEEKECIRQMFRLVYLYSLRTLLELGWKPKPGDKIEATKGFCEQYKILPCFAQLIHFYFTMYRDENGIMEFKDGIWEVKHASVKSIEDINREAETLYGTQVKVERFRVLLNIHKHIGQHLPKILTGEESVLPILFPNESGGDKESLQYSAEMYYQNYTGRQIVHGTSLMSLGRILRYLHETSIPGKSVLRVLEVGAGTGSMSDILIPVLAEIWGQKFEFYYTDISATFFAKADKRLEEYKQNIKFATFNIEESPLEQGIPLNYFDMVLATDVLHATRSLSECAVNLRQVLKPQGLLYFTESIIADWGVTFVFGLLEGYWRFDDFDVRPYHCCVGGETWKQVLMRNGFDFVNVTDVYHDFMGIVTAQGNKKPGNEIATFNREKSLKNESKKWIYFSPNQDDLTAALISEKVMNVIKACGGGYIQTVIKPSNNEDIESFVKSALENCGEDNETQAIIYGWGMDENEKDQSRIALPFLLIAQHLLNLKKPPKTYVLTKGVHSFTEESEDFTEFNPSGATLFGMAKSLKNESSEIFVRYVDLDRSANVDASVEQILFELALTKDFKERDRVQVAYREGLRYEPRFNRALVPSKLKDDLQLPPSTDRYKLVLPKTKMISDLTFDILGEENDGILGENEVEVQTKAYALNFRDIFAILKPSESFDKLNTVGLDFSGIVTKIGKGVENDENGLRVGERVFGANFDDCQLPSHQVMEQDLFMRIPENLSFAEAATLPAVVSTAVYCLINVAKMEKGDFVLIHTGSGGVGLAAIQLAKHVGAEIITTAGSPRKRKYLRDLGIQHVFHSRDTSYEQEIMKVTNGRGVDIVLNSITGPGFKEATLRSCAKNARFVEMSKLAVWTSEEVKALRPDVEYTIADLTTVGKPMILQLVKSCRKLLDVGGMKPIPYVKFDALRVRQALQYMQKAKHIGKVVVTMPEVITRNGQWNVEVPLFSEDSTYVITGGLGGIGLEICKWILSKGATDVVLIGRNEPKPEVKQEIERLNREGRYNVLVRLGDVGNFNECKEIISWIIENCKPIRGIHHCAGVLKDNLYSNQTWENFRMPYKPKIEGTWNLHELTKHLSLEHFVFYSSVTSLVGTPAQPNHSSANCFEDAFAHYRNSLGLPATTINWGQWGQVGCAKDTNISGLLPVSVERMLNALEETLRSQVLQVCFGDFESLAMWSVFVPLFKNYLDEKLLKSLKDNQEPGNNILLKSDKFWEEMDGALTKQEKMGVVSVYMKVIIRSGLRMEADEPISDDANMKELGVDSLMLIELKNSIQSLLGSRLQVTANMLKDCNTIRDLAQCIVSKLYEDCEEMAPSLMEDLPTEELIALLKEDLCLEEDIKAGDIPSRKIGDIKTVLLTGATGHLGPYVLSLLSTKYGEHLENIVCLVKTPKDGSVKAEDKLGNILKSSNIVGRVDMKKVTCLKGDVALEYLGLEKETYDDLCGRVDAVIHLVAKSNHIEPYRKWDKGTNDIRSVNVGGTRNILKFCAERKTKYLYYASSILAVFGGNVDEGKLTDDWPEHEWISRMEEHRIPGYPVSKFVCEILCKQAKERGIPCKVFRFPWIMGDSKTGQLNYMSNHYILRFLSYMKSKSMPMAPLPALVLPVDICADLSLKLFLNGDAPWELYNIAHPEPQMEVEFIQVAKKDFGVEIEMVDYRTEEFMESMYKPGMPLEGLKEMYSDLERIMNVTTSEKFQAIQGYVAKPEVYFRNDKVEKYVPGFAKEFGTTMETIRRDLKYVKEQGFFTRFGL